MGTGAEARGAGPGVPGEPGAPVPVVFGVPRAQGGLGVLGVRRAGGVAVLHSGAGVFCPPGARVWSITALHLLGGYPWGLQVLQAALISQMGEASEHPRGSPCKSLPPNGAAGGGRGGQERGRAGERPHGSPWLGGCGAGPLPLEGWDPLGPPQVPQAGLRAPGVQGAVLSPSQQKGRLSTGAGKQRLFVPCPFVRPPPPVPSPPGFCLFPHSSPQRPLLPSLWGEMSSEFQHPWGRTRGLLEPGHCCVSRAASGVAGGYLAGTAWSDIPCCVPGWARR